MTQGELAARVGIKEQQIQRHEATDYASTSLTRINEILCKFAASFVFGDKRSSA